MRVGVHIDGFNLYYGDRGLCGRLTPGWRWLDRCALQVAQPRQPLMVKDGAGRDRAAAVRNASVARREEKGPDA